MTAVQTPQATPLETTAFDELGGSFRGVKAKYDPDNAFHHNKDIQPG